MRRDRCLVFYVIYNHQALWTLYILISSIFEIGLNNAAVQSHSQYLKGKTKARRQKIATFTVSPRLYQLLNRTSTQALQDGYNRLRLNRLQWAHFLGGVRSRLFGPNHI